MQNCGKNERKPRNRRSHGVENKQEAVHRDSGVGRPVNNMDEFYFSGEEIKSAPYHYTMCGLDGIYLLNGYHIEYHDGEQFVSITDSIGLHKAIGRFLVLHRKALSQKEIRFLRWTLELTQNELAQKLGTTSQTVARWEKGACDIPGTSEKLLRVLFFAQVIRNDEDSKILLSMLRSAMDELDKNDEFEPEEAQFRLEDDWESSPQPLAA
jgi:DNA-binding transcriptional regulator YiaG